MIRKVLAVLVGGIAGGVFNMALVNVSQVMYPLPGNAPPTIEAIRAHVEVHGMAAGALVIVLLAHSGGSFVSGFVCGLIALRSWYAAAAGLGVLWTCGGIAMLFMLPAPTWFAVADVALYVPAALLGVRLGGVMTGRGSTHVASAEGVAG